MPVNGLAALLIYIIQRVFMLVELFALNAHQPRKSNPTPMDWSVWFRFTHEGKEIPRKFRDGINRIKNKAVRMIQSEKNCQKYTEWLKAGWNPIIDPEFKVQQIKPAAVRKGIFLKEGLAFALGKKDQSN